MYPNILRLFDDVQRLKRPKIVVGDLKVSTARPQHPARLHVAYLRNYLGGIMPDGTFRTRIPVDRMPPRALELLRELERDPHDLLVREGKRAQRCCLCRTPLTDERSKAAGYGPRCAENWGLPWGEAGNLERKIRVLKERLETERATKVSLTVDEWLERVVE